MQSADIVLIKWMTIRRKVRGTNFVNCRWGNQITWLLTGNILTSWSLHSWGFLQTHELPWQIWHHTIQTHTVPLKCTWRHHNRDSNCQQTNHFNLLVGVRTDGLHISIFWSIRWSLSRVLLTWCKQRWQSPRNRCLQFILHDKYAALRDCSVIRFRCA